MIPTRTEELLQNKRIKSIITKLGNNQRVLDHDPYFLASKNKNPKEDLSAEDLLSLFRKGSLTEQETMFWLGVLAIRHEEQAKKHQELAIIDELTKVYNRRFFIDSLSRELERLRNKTIRAMEEAVEVFHLSLLMVDIDHFKRVNDSYGHQVGDQVLARTAELIKDTVRSTDTVFRYGGEEFTVMLPETNEATAEEVAERVRHKIEKSVFPIPEKGVVKKIKRPRRITVSIGLATIAGNELIKKPVTDSLIPVLIRQADEALYKAKQSGRNQIVKGGK